ncbi:MAG: hypothetical protein QF472_03510 [Candidatus Marinimicrobia bacterium]|jgi:hypothetical protein|nr:hypothetical protein [Candidatus Neomarinimicrobiota bacterium]
MQILFSYHYRFLFLLLTGFLLLSGCARISNYTLEDVEKQRLNFLNGKQKSLVLLMEIYKDPQQSYEVRLAAMRALSESRDPMVIRDIQSTVGSASLIELDLMKEAIQILLEYDDVASTDSLIAALTATEKKSNEIRTDILEAVGKNGTKDEVYLLIKLYEVSKKSNARMNFLLAETLGEIGDEKVIPILMEMAKNTNLPVETRSRAVEVLSKKDAPELVDFFIEMLGDPGTRDKVNEYAFNVMGDMPEERMIMALVEAYQTSRHKYYSLLNTVMGSLDNFDNPEIKSIYLEIAQTTDFPGKIRLKAFKGLTRYSDPEVIEGVVELLNDPANYIYYNEIVGMLHDYGVYKDYQDELRMAAFRAMQKEAELDHYRNE